MGDRPIGVSHEDPFRLALSLALSLFLSNNENFRRRSTCILTTRPSGSGSLHFVRGLKLYGRVYYIVSKSLLVSSERASVANSTEGCGAAKEVLRY